MGCIGISDKYKICNHFAGRFLAGIITSQGDRMGKIIAFVAATAIAAIASEAPKAPQWEPIDPGALGRFARDTTHAHQLDSVAHVQIQAGQVIRQNALQNLGDDIHYTQGDSVDLGRGIIKRSSPEKSKKTTP